MSKGWGVLVGLWLSAGMLSPWAQTEGAGVQGTVFDPSKARVDERPLFRDTQVGRFGYNSRRTRGEGPTTMVTKAVSLDACVEQTPNSQGVHISRLEPFQNVRIQTQNNPYSLYVLEPTEGRILVRGGQYFPEYKEAYLCGSSWGGSILRV